jgi:hypothetical protein
VVYRGRADEVIARLSRTNATSMKVIAGLLLVAAAVLAYALTRPSA